MASDEVIWLQVVVNPYDSSRHLNHGYRLAQYVAPDVQQGGVIGLLNEEEDDHMGALAAVEGTGEPRALSKSQRRRRKRVQLKRKHRLEREWVTLQEEARVVCGVAERGQPSVLTIASVERPTDAEVAEAMPPGQDFRPLSKQQATGFEDLTVEKTIDQKRETMREKVMGVETLSESEREEVMEMMEKHLVTFSDSPGYSTLAELQINTGDALPVSKRPYRNPLVANAGFLKQLEQWEEAGIIRRSKSAWAAPCLLVPKKNGKWRTVIDYRGLNKLLAKESNPVPIITEVLDTMGGAKFFSTMDLTSGFYQLRVRE